MTIASQTEGAGPGGFLMEPRRDNRRAFRAAMRHSRLVRITRVGLPLVIVLCAAVFGAYRWVDPMRVLTKLPVSTEGVLVSGTKIVMREPRLTGFTKDERPYVVTARTAAKDLANPDLLELGHIHTTITMQDGRNVELTATDGLYNGKADTLRLFNGVVVSSPDYKITLREAVANIKAGSVVSDQPVEVKMLQGTVNANRLDVTESGAVVRFSGGVTLVIEDDNSIKNMTGATNVTGAIR
ncbi:MAG: LPS export ABC transporter periplasmic protein LptC [Xanthobacteraceae bacterium]|nr:LPS export ABC transporter periplasmic protein LptC [Xanthobacteraceae bacterium]